MRPHRALISSFPSQVARRVAALQSEVSGRSAECAAMEAALSKERAQLSAKTEALVDLKAAAGAAAAARRAQSRHGQQSGGRSSPSKDGERAAAGAAALESDVIAARRRVRQGTTALTLATLELRRVRSLLRSFTARLSDDRPGLAPRAVPPLAVPPLSPRGEAKLLRDRRSEATHVAKVKSLMRLEI